jgi:H2-forming N5,N10-methylenetetrahydromethanopterin dehydrogenase-like enzyme
LIRPLECEGEQTSAQNENMSNVPSLLSVLFLCSTAGYSTLAQMTAAPVNPGLFEQAEHVTLTSALILAVIMLWKTVNRKDEQITKVTQQMIDATASSTASTTAALVQTSNTNTELRKVVEESVEAKKKLATAIEELGLRMNTLPCVSQEAEDRGGRH